MPVLEYFYPFKYALKKIDTFFNSEMTLDTMLYFTEMDYSENYRMTVWPNGKDYKEIADDAAFLNLIFYLGKYLKFSKHTINGMIETYQGELNDDYLIKFIIINYYCYKLDGRRIGLIRKEYKSNIKINDIHDDYKGDDANELLDNAKSFLILIFEHYCKENKKENLNKLNYKNFSPNTIYKHITGKSGITDKTNNEEGGKTRRRQKRKSKRKSTKRRTKRKLRRKNTKK